MQSRGGKRLAAHTSADNGDDHETQRHQLSVVPAEITVAFEEMQNLVRVVLCIIHKALCPDLGNMSCSGSFKG